MSMKLIAAAISMLAMTACTSTGRDGLVPISDDAKLDFEYRFSIPHSDRDQLWGAARIYFEEIENLSFQDEDADTGSFEGSALAPWLLADGTLCYSRYQLKFMAENEKITLQITLDSGEAEGSLSCSQWMRPPQLVYAQIVEKFSHIADGLRTSLSAGEGKTGKRGF